jgi:hypothetical protein
MYDRNRLTHMGGVVGVTSESAVATCSIEHRGGCGMCRRTRHIRPYGEAGLDSRSGAGIGGQDRGDRQSLGRTVTSVGLGDGLGERGYGRLGIETRRGDV